MRLGIRANIRRYKGWILILGGLVAHNFLHATGFRQNLVRRKQPDEWHREVISVSWEELPPCDCCCAVRVAAVCCGAAGAYTFGCTYLGCGSAMLCAACLNTIKPKTHISSVAILSSAPPVQRMAPFTGRQAVC